MPRNGSGQYVPPTNSFNPAINGTLATAGDWQSLLNDIVAALSQSVSNDGQTPLTGPLNAGNNPINNVTAGTGTGQALAFQQLFAQGTMADLASAATTDIGAQNTNFLRITGNTTITSFGTNYRGPRFLVFEGAVTLTNSSTLVLPGGANITTAAGDVLIAIPGATLGTADKWIVAAYQAATGYLKSNNPSYTGTLTGGTINSAANPLVLQTGGSERARIDSSGNLLVGGTSMVSSGRALIQWNSANGIEGLILYDTDSTAVGRFALKFNRNGTVVGSIQTTTTATSYVTSSDYRLKENIQPMTGALAKVSALKPVTYNWKADGSDGEGFIAHELQEVCPQAVTGEKDAVDAEGKPVYQGIDTSFLTATLTAAIQEQQATITAQAAQIQQLREKVLEVEEGTSNMLVENTNNLYETITALTARVAALEAA